MADDDLGDWRSAPADGEDALVTRLREVAGKQDAPPLSLLEDLRRMGYIADPGEPASYSRLTGRQLEVQAAAERAYQQGWARGRAVAEDGQRDRLPSAFWLDTYRIAFKALLRTSETGDVLDLAEQAIEFTNGFVGADPVEGR